MYNDDPLRQAATRATHTLLHTVSKYTVVSATGIGLAGLTKGEVAESYMRDAK